jgi:hypothetical protein
MDESREDAKGRLIIGLSHAFWIPAFAGMTLELLLKLTHQHVNAIQPLMEFLDKSPALTSIFFHQIRVNPSNPFNPRSISF